MEDHRIALTLIGLEESIMSITTAAHGPPRLRLYASLAALAANLCSLDEHGTMVDPSDALDLTHSILAIWSSHTSEESVLERVLSAELGRQRAQLLTRRHEERAQHLNQLRTSGASVSDLISAEAEMDDDDARMLISLSTKFSSRSAPFRNALVQAQIAEFRHAVGLRDSEEEGGERGWTAILSVITQLFEADWRSLDCTFDHQRLMLEKSLAAARLGKVERLKELTSACASPGVLVTDMGNAMAQESQAVATMEHQIRRAKDAAASELRSWHECGLKALTSAITARQDGTEVTSLVPRLTRDFKDHVGRELAAQHLISKLCAMQGRDSEHSAYESDESDESGEPRNLGGKGEAAVDPEWNEFVEEMTSLERQADAVQADAPGSSSHETHDEMAAA